MSTFLNWSTNYSSTSNQYWQQSLTTIVS